MNNALVCLKLPEDILVIPLIRCKQAISYEALVTNEDEIYGKILRGQMKLELPHFFDHSNANAFQITHI